MKAYDSDANTIMLNDTNRKKQLCVSSYSCDYMSLNSHCYTIVIVKIHYRSHYTLDTSVKAALCSLVLM